MSLRMPVRRHPTMAAYRKFYYLVFLCVLFGSIVALLSFLWPLPDDGSNMKKRTLNFANSEKITLPKTAVKSIARDKNCTYHTCFDVYNCGYDDVTKISIYVYPYKEYTNEKGEAISPLISREFYEVLDAIIDSPFYTDDPSRACLYVPSIDLLNQNILRKEEISQVLASLQWWNNGTNHLLFNMLPGALPDYSTVMDVDTGKAVIAGAGFSTWSYRRTFDVAIPLFNPIVINLQLPFKSYLAERKWLITSSQFGLHEEYMTVIQKLGQLSNKVIVYDKCEGSRNYLQRCKGNKSYAYPRVLQDSTFCFVIRGARLVQTVLFDSLMAGCIPVIVADGYVLPFSEVLDWKRAAVIIREDQLEDTLKILSNYSISRIHDMRRQINFLYNRYFSSMRAITKATLQIINDRVFPYVSRKDQDWNEIPNPLSVSNPLFLPLQPANSQGFTAVVLTYDRLDSLYEVIRQVAKVPSLAKVVVVWNNQKKSPPPDANWPKIGKPVKVIRTRQNKLSNRFFPYDEIETECILALDDDIVMLTADELEFGYQVWREFPDRLVGFPSRLHLWDNTTQKWRYESEWTNAISMVLTGAAFYHKYFSYLYTSSMPGNIKSWVDEHMNCEDIAMNFLISNITGKSPMKVAPRKKFKCPQCVNTENLSADITHMVERSDCINQFISVYNTMPLKSVEFRADPVLYKDNFPTLMKKFNDIGSL